MHFAADELAAGFLGYVTRLWGTRAQRLRCYAAGSRPVEKDKNDPTTADRCTLTLHTATFMPFTSVVR
jgi:hypothetical protein